MKPALIDFHRVLDPEVLLLLLDDDRDGLPDAEVLEAAVAGARGEVESRLRGRLAPDPDSSASPLLLDLVRTLAVERLFERRPGPIPPAWVERARRCRLLLEEIARGERAPDGTIAPRQRVRSTTTREQRHSTPEQLRDL